MSPLTLQESRTSALECHLTYVSMQTCEAPALGLACPLCGLHRPERSQSPSDVVHSGGAILCGSSQPCSPGGPWQAGGWCWVSASGFSQHALEPTWEQPAGSATGQRRSALGILSGSLPQLAMCSPPFLDSKFWLSTQCLGIALCAKRALAAHSPTMCSQP